MTFDQCGCYEKDRILCDRCFGPIKEVLWIDLPFGVGDMISHPDDPTGLIYLGVDPSCLYNVYHPDYGHVRTDWPRIQEYVRVEDVHGAS